MDHLAQRGLLDMAALGDDYVRPTPTMVPAPLLDRVRDANETDADLLATLGLLTREYPLEGVDGLKHRTGLLEHRYDAV